MIGRYSPRVLAVFALAGLVLVVGVVSSRQRAPGQPQPDREPPPEGGAPARTPHVRDTGH
jgi:hypothetical protein